MNKGQKVICTDGKFPESVLDLYAQLPTEGQVYVIRDVRVGVRVDELIMDCRRVLDSSLLLVGIANPCNNIGVEAGFKSSRFATLESVQARNQEEEFAKA